MGSLIALLLGWPVALVIFMLNYSARGGIKRFVALIVCVILGGVSLVYGYILAFQGAVVYPVAGVICIIIGIIIGIFGTIRSLTIKNEIDEIDWEEGFEELIRGLFDIFLPPRKK